MNRLKNLVFRKIKMIAFFTLFKLTKNEHKFIDLENLEKNNLPQEFEVKLLNSIKKNEPFFLSESGGILNGLVTKLTPYTFKKNKEKFLIAFAEQFSGEDVFRFDRLE